MNKPLSKSIRQGINRLINNNSPYPDLYLTSESDEYLEYRMSVAGNRVFETSDDIEMDILEVAQDAFTSMGLDFEYTLEVTDADDLIFTFYSPLSLSTPSSGEKLITPYKFVEDVLKFFDGISTSLSLEVKERNSLSFSTREHGDVGDEIYSVKDYNEAVRVGNLILREFPETSADIETIDEWVILNVNWD